MAWEELGKSSVTLSGRNITKEIIVNALAFTDSVWRTYDINMLSSEDVLISVSSTINQTVTMRVLGPNSTSKAARLFDASTNLELIVPANDASYERIITKNNWPLLGMADNFRLSFYCSVAPTSGSITITVYRKPH